MGFVSWLANKLNGQVPMNVKMGDIFGDDETFVDLYIRELAFWQAVNLIANAISKCEFRTFVNNKETKDLEYYRWNIEPNANQNSSAFLKKLISKLYRENECLVIRQDQKLFVADSFSVIPSVLNGNAYNQVRVDDLTFNKVFTQEQVFYWRMASENIRKLLNSMYQGYSKLISYGMTSYQRSRGTKGIFHYDTFPTAGTDEEKAFDELINGRISKWLNSDTAALPLGRGQDFKELERKTYNNESTRDIRALINDVFDFTANAFLVPPSLLRGDVAGTDPAFELMLSLCIDPLADMLSEEINRKINGYSGFKAGNYLMIDTKTIKHIDLMDMGANVEKLVSSGLFSVNDLLRTLGEPQINEPWANEHWMTKNFESVMDSLRKLNGGGDT